MTQVYVDNKLTKVVDKNTIDKIELDKPIALLILLLNRKGYETLFSCSGHDDGIGYISFKYNNKVNDLCNHIFNIGSKDSMVSIRIKMLKSVKTISIYQDNNDTEWITKLTNIIKHYLWVTDDWVKNKIEFTKNYPFEQDFLNQWLAPTKTE